MTAVATWTCPCGEKVPVEAQWSGRQLVFSARSWADVWAHAWTHESQ